MKGWGASFAEGTALLAHAGEVRPRGWDELASAWDLDPFVMASLFFVGAIYWQGVRWQRRRLSAERGLKRWERGCFWAGWAALVVALVSPLHPWGQVLFSAHMTQHELLMVMAAPLIVLGRPVVALMFALPVGDARVVSRIARVRGVRAVWRLLTQPLAAWALHAAALWLWHIPAFFEATLRSDTIHHAQHASFFGTALLFWWALIHGRAGLKGVAVATLYLFTTMLHSGLLGALLTFAETPLYPAYAATAADWALTPQEDQQLGGLIMWVPAGLVYVCAALALLAGWLRDGDRQVSLRWAGKIPSTLVIACVVFVAGCDARRGGATVAAGDVTRGRELVSRVGCAACHTIPGVPGAHATVGPSLAGIGERTYIGGVLPNEPEKMVQWLLDPTRHNPRTTMPDVNLSEADARDVAAYLYTLQSP